jgi:uncharacterized membrane protein (DUF441 family)
MIIGTGLLMTYIDGDQLNYILVLSLLLITAGIIITITQGEITFRSFFSSFMWVTEKYWSVVLIFAGVFLLFRKGNT